MFCAIGMFLWIPAMVLEEVLLKAGVLNTKDLPPFVGTESGTPMEYLLNVWHWDAGVLLLAGLGAVCLFVLLLSGDGERSRKRHETRA
jgi:hypothetical protein